MSDSTTVGDIRNSQAIAIGENASATVINLPQPRPDAVSNLPLFNPNFTGRQKQLADIATHFTPSSLSPQHSPLIITQAISGIGGVGKTEIALAYAHTHSDQYDIIWQLQADNTLALDHSLRQLGMTLQLDVIDKDAPTLRSIVLSYLSRSKKDVLLLYDNADEIAPRDLRPYLPTACHLLITSRRDHSQWSGIARTVTLGTFTEAEAEGFWERRMGDGAGVQGSGGDGEWGELAKELGYLPLAMEQAAAFMLQRKKSATAYLQQFTERRTALWAREKAPNNYHATVASTWQMGFDHAKKTNGAADLLNLCAFFAPEGIPLAMLQEQADSLPQPLATVLTDEDQREDALVALSAYSLLTVADDKLSIHRLVQAVAREQMGAEEAQEWVQVAVKVFYEAYNFDPLDMDTWAQCGQLLPHVTTVANLAAELNVDSEQTASLNNSAGLYLQQYGEYAAARPFFERALTIKETKLGPDHPSTATSLNNLGELLRMTGKYEEALPFYERALVIFEKNLSPDDPNIAAPNNNLGLLLQTIGEYKQARPFYERALAICEAQLGPDHPHTATSLNNLGELLRMMGEYEQARPFYERALTIREAQLGSDHPDIAQSLNNLGLLMQAMGEYGQARPFYERALAINEAQLGPDHPQTAQSLNNLGYLLQAMGKDGQALPFYERALAIREAQLDPDHPDIAQSLNNLGLLMQAMGEYEQARPFYERALAIDEKALGPDHPDTAIDLNNLALLLYYEKDIPKAARLMRRALAIYEKAWGNDHPDAQSTHQSLAIIEAALP